MRYQITLNGSGDSLSIQHKASETADFKEIGRLKPDKSHGMVAEFFQPVPVADLRGLTRLIEEVVIRL